VVRTNTGYTLAEATFVPTITLASRCCSCRLVQVACKCVLKQLPAESLEVQQQWPCALALVAAEAVAYARHHLDR
jgi:hypothetical protein